VPAKSHVMRTVASLWSVARRAHTLPSDGFARQRAVVVYVKQRIACRIAAPMDGWIRKVGVGGIACVAVLAFAASARAESVSIFVGTNPAVGQTLELRLEGVADGDHNLYAYVDAGGQSCAVDPHDELTQRVVHALSAVSPIPGEPEGDQLSAGSFRKVYPYMPSVGGASYEVCAYLDSWPTNLPDASAAERFSVPGGPVKAPYTEEASRALKQLAVEHEEQLQRERIAKQQREHEEYELMHPATEHIQPGQPTADHTASHARCFVPALKGHSLTYARTMLRHAHCRLGAIKRSARAHGALVVTQQSPRYGRKLPKGTPVAITLGR
jgi:hypothetical protein